MRICVLRMEAKFHNISKINAQILLKTRRMMRKKYSMRLWKGHMINAPRTT
jgi:hypothetical protein